MSPNELATFLREDYPEMLRVYEEAGFYPASFRQMKDALDAALGLLREAENALTEVTVHRPEMEVRHFTISHMPGWTGCKVCQTLATLRLVVGGKDAPSL